MGRSWLFLEPADEMFPWQLQNKRTVVVSVPLAPGGHENDT